ncbi:hypothetical protein RRG08_020964 [Elysia crispata]|uniref:Uncharacterized protein n=1 Tax=Elysia crispata TaxID=231223 RepID=A0AAE1B9P7_9GAST|nr:hypothetical protein RRG08_020964 [Elysia crispata]
MSFSGRAETSRTITHSTRQGPSRSDGPYRTTESTGRGSRWQDGSVRRRGSLSRLPERPSYSFDSCFSPVTQVSGEASLCSVHGQLLLNTTQL